MAITLNWDSKFEIGHERIDSEHRIFLGLIRDLSNEANPHGDRERAFRLLSEIYKYADFHFVSEENVMADVAYPELDAHRRLHLALLAELRDCMFRFRSADATVEQAVEFLFTWFALHTTREDKRITDYIAKSAAVS